MILLAVYFNRGGTYKPLLRAFAKSADRHVDGTVSILQIPMPPKADHKRDTATAFIAAANMVLNMDENIAVCDCDLMFAGDISDAFEYDFDIGITVRESFKHPYNTGLWFYRPTDNARLFVNEWIGRTQVLVEHFDQNLDFITQHGGIDQASLALTLDSHIPCKVNRFPCHVWNAEQSTWKYMNYLTKVVHIKSGLRKACLTGKHDDKLREQWPDDAARDAVVQTFKEYQR